MVSRRLKYFVGGQRNETKRGVSAGEQLLPGKLLAARLAEPDDKILDRKAAARGVPHVEYNLAVMQHYGAGAEIERLTHGMGNHEHGEPEARRERGGQLQHEFGIGWVECGGVFVEQHD